MFSKRVYLRKEIREESLHKIVSYLDNKLPEDFTDFRDIDKFPKL